MVMQYQKVVKHQKFEKDAFMANLVYLSHSIGTRLCL